MRCSTLVTAEVACLVLALLLPLPAIGQFEFFKSAASSDGDPVSYLARVNAKPAIVLDANNGFFDKEAFKAEGQHAAAPWDTELIKAHFTHLVPVAGSFGLSARWHVWLKQTGNLDLTVQMEGVEGLAGEDWSISLDGQSLRLAERNGKTQRVSFRVANPGKHTVFLRRFGGANPVKIKQLSLGGAAAKNARVLRARWRPAAVHTQYHCSDCPKTRMWVFESQSLTDETSYSPMTTQFGYFGGSFDDDQTAHGNLNFSMWAASSKAKTAPPLETMPHLIGTGNPMAQFSGFGHEGSGVKIRNWDPIAKSSRSITLALRVETNGSVDTFTGYFFDELQHRWVLFAKANKPIKKMRGRKPGDPTYLRPASFCEVPGPPSVQRSGDRRRVIRRRGWFYGDDARWHGVDRQTTKSSGPTNKSIATADGWFVMATGGIEMMTPKAEVTLAPIDQLPEYLSENLTQQLFQYPIEFASSSISRVSSDAAVIDYMLKDAGTNAKAVLYYGLNDCLAFVDRKLHGTESKGVSSAMLAPGRTWENKTDSIPVRTGSNLITLQDLQPSTKYFYRLLVRSEEGKCWDSRSGSFVTE